jgi:large subunit ribosomal protein L17
MHLSLWQSRFFFRTLVMMSPILTLFPTHFLSLLAELASNILEGAQNGSKWFAMRHGNRKITLNRPADQRKALIRGLVTEVLRHGKITTTKTRAKAIRKHVDKMIGLAKRGTLHARRQALAFVYDPALVKSVFENAPSRYNERPGGYCRVVTELQRRKGDNAEMATIELV